MIRFKPYLIILIYILFASCAQIVSPNGGAKDETAPKILSEVPKNKSIKFKEDKIVITFDEFIRIDNPDQIIISPLPEVKPEIDFKGKQAIVTFKKPLISDKTYTINFANAITDIHEGKALDNYQYTFSTGDYLDSNAVFGSVYNAFTLKPENDITCCLYTNRRISDTTFSKTYADYIAKTDIEGNFKIENLPNDTFVLVAFKDQNKNFKLEPNEYVAFSSNQIYTANKTENIKLKLFEPNQFIPNLVLDTIRPFNQVYQLVVYKADTSKINCSLKHLLSIQEGKNHIDTLNYFIISDREPEFKIAYADSTVNFQIKKIKSNKDHALKLTINGVNNPTDTVYITSNQPISSFNKAFFTFKEDTNIIKDYFCKLINPFKMAIYYPFKFKNTYSISVNDSSITGFYNQYNQKVFQNFSIPAEKDFGSLILNIKNPEKERIILQLVTSSEQEDIIYETVLSTDKAIHIPYLMPNKLKAKVIFDTNINGKWDNGDLRKKQPEDVSYYSETIEIRAFWDLEQTLHINELKPQ